MDFDIEECYWSWSVDGNKNDGIELPLYDFATISAATNNFSETSIIGKGGFGPVYKVRKSFFVFKYCDL